MRFPATGKFEFPPPTNFTAHLRPLALVFINKSFQYTENSSLENPQTFFQEVGSEKGNFRDDKKKGCENICLRKVIKLVTLKHLQSEFETISYLDNSREPPLIMNFPAFGTFPSIHQFSTAVTSSSVPSSQENRYSYQTTVPVSSAQVKFRAEEMAAGVQNKYVTHYPTSSSTTAHLQYYNPPSAVSNHQSSSQNDSQPKTSYIQTSLPSATTVVTASSAELSQDITNMLLKEQSNSDQAKRVLQTTSSVADYLSHLPTSLSLHHFLKYSADAATAIKKEGVVVGQSTQLNLIPSSSSIANIIQHHPNVVQCGSGQTIVHNIATQQLNNATATNNTTNNAPTKKKKKKKAPKEKKPKPKAGEIRLKFALDGSMLFVCPECQVAYPEKEILDQHMINHQSLERRFVCEICNAALKRKGEEFNMGFLILLLVI